jgi:hypothetical protein
MAAEEWFFSVQSEWWPHDTAKEDPLEGMFSVWPVPGLYKCGAAAIMRVVSVVIVVVVESWLVGQVVERCCGWGTGTVQEPRGKGTFPVGSHYQKTGEDHDWGPFCVCECVCARKCVCMRVTPCTWQYVAIHSNILWHTLCILAHTICQFVVCFCHEVRSEHDSTGWPIFREKVSMIVMPFPPSFKSFLFPTVFCYAFPGFHSK